MTTSIPIKQVFKQPESYALEERLDYCQGCGHGIALRLVSEVIDEMGLRENAMAVLGVGCYSTNSVLFNFDTYWVTHGRAPAHATAVKRLRPEHLVFTLQGDGDCAAIGTTEIVHAAGRGERFTTIMLNNSNYGETGGQLAPTTVLGQKTKSTARGRDAELHGQPIRLPEMLATMDSVVYCARGALNSPMNIGKAKKAIRAAFEIQRQGTGFGFVELLTACPSGWRLTPAEAMEWMKNVQSRTFPLGVIKEPE
ncbi:MAG: thiamine pyrophosphate-dependent enzyme [Gammaproteobacteria bacterium]